MRKERVITLLVLFLLVAPLVLSFVSAQLQLDGSGDNSGSVVGSSSGAAAIFDPIKELFSNWENGKTSENVAKYLLWVIVGLFVYSILDYIPFTKGKGRGWIRAVLAIVIGFLSIAFLSRYDVYTILASYSALGFVLSAIVPFMILLFGSIEVHRTGGAAGKIGVKIVWFAFIIWLIVKLLVGAFIDHTISQYHAWGYIIFIVASIIWLFVVEKTFVKWIRNEEFEQKKEVLNREVEGQDAKRKIESRSFEKGEGI